MGVHRSRFELEQVLDRYGATDFACVEADASSAIQFAMDGRYVQVTLPLPDPDAVQFTHTASGRRRAPETAERAYEQALREHWRGLLLAVRGKLQSVESGLSTFDQEFGSFLVPHLEEKRKGERKKPRAVNWLLGSSHSLAIALVAAFFVPASAVGAFALPPTMVDHLAAPFRGALPSQLGAADDDDGRALALGQSVWFRGESASSHVARPSRSAHRGFAAKQPDVDERTVNTPSGELAAASLGGLRQDGGSGDVAPPPAQDSPGPPPAPSGGPPPSAPAPSVEEPAPDVLEDPNEPGSATDGEAAADDGSETAAPSSDDPGNAEPSAGEPDNGHDNGNHNGADNGNGNGNGNSQSAPPADPPKPDQDPKPDKGKDAKGQ